jgi:hypothetical protein
MKTVTLTMTEKSLETLHKFLARADLKGREVPEFLQLLQELRPTPPSESPASPAPSR